MTGRTERSSAAVTVAMNVAYGSSGNGTTASNGPARRNTPLAHRARSIAAHNKAGLSSSESRVTHATYPRSWPTHCRAQVVNAVVFPDPAGAHTNVTGGPADVTVTASSSSAWTRSRSSVVAGLAGIRIFAAATGMRGSTVSATRMTRLTAASLTTPSGCI